MSKTEGITLRAVEPPDIDLFYQQQLDPEAIRLAAFVHKDPADKVAFAAHWHKILHTAGITNRTVLVGSQVAGHIACFPQDGNLEVTYWLGREFWGRGVATQALTLLLQLITERPICARAAKDNFGSVRVLLKCGFKIIGEDQGFAHGRNAETEEYLLRLDPPQATS